MADGDSGHWQAIDELRKRSEQNTARIAVLESEIRGLHDDIKELGASINGRLDRTRNTALALLAVAVPVISGLVGALIQSGGS